MVTMAACGDLTQGIPAGEHLMDMFKLEEFERYEGGGAGEEYFNAADFTHGQRQEAAKEEEEQEEDEFRSAEAEVLVTRRHCNYKPGTMHGGAVAVAAEEIARRCPPAPLPLSGASVPENPRVQYMEVSRFNALGGMSFRPVHAM